MTIYAILASTVLHVVNLRLMFQSQPPAEGSDCGAVDRFVAELQRRGLVQHIGLSNATPAQVAEAHHHNGRLRTKHVQYRAAP